jgi:hypothetical protein
VQQVLSILVVAAEVAELLILPQHLVLVGVVVQV